MNVPLLLFVLRLCFWLSTVALLPLGYGFFLITSDDADEWPQVLSFAIGQLVVMALMTCSLILLGHSISALWVWRVLSAISSVLSGVLCAVMIRRKSLNPRYDQVGVNFVFLATALTVFFFVCSTIVTVLPHAVPAASTVFAVDSATSLTQISFWHVALYVILALSTVVFGLLFISASRSDGPLSFERSGGGLGVASGSWEVSNSLTYLVATIALSALLLTLIAHNDTIDQQAEQRQAAAAAQNASHPANVQTLPATPIPKEQASKPVPEPAGAETHGH